MECNGHSVNVSHYDNRPLTPPPEDCCGNGCDPCILDVHKKLLERWYQKQNGENEKSKCNLLSQIAYKKFVLNGVQKNSEDSMLVSLQYKGELDDSELFFNPGQYIILRAKSVSRSFTPISWSERNILLLIKLYPDGKFSTYLKDAHIGDEIDVRGPYGDFHYEFNSFQRVVMFSVGSGIAAIYPIAKAIADNESEETTVHIIAGFRSVPHVPLKKELQCLSDYWNFKCTLCVSQRSENSVHGLNLRYGRIDREFVRDSLECGEREKTLVLVCGTQQFNRMIEEWVDLMNYSHVHVFE